MMPAAIPHGPCCANAASAFTACGVFTGNCPSTISAAALRRRRGRSYLRAATTSRLGRRQYRSFRLVFEQASGMKSLPADTLRVGCPVLVGSRVAAGCVRLVFDTRIGGGETALDFRQFVSRIGLQAQMADALVLFVCGNGEVDPRLVDHPFCVVGFEHRRICPEETGIEPHACGQVRDAQVHVKTLHFNLLNWCWKVLLRKRRILYFYNSSIMEIYCAVNPPTGATSFATAVRAEISTAANNDVAANTSGYRRMKCGE